MDSNKFRPMGPWILIRANKPETVSAGGLYLPEGNMQERLGHLTGTVLSVGPGKFNTGKKAIKNKYESHDLKVGDKVTFRGFLKEANQPFDDRSLCLLHIDDVLGYTET